MPSLYYLLSIWVTSIKKISSYPQDGSSLHIHASPFGHQITDQPLFRFSAPDADLGWDSDLASFYLGYTFYNISNHNTLKNIDSPVFITLEKASRHDALAIYKYFDEKNITAIIDHNKRNDSKKNIAKFEYINNDGVPVCQAGVEMVHFGYDIQRERTKYRCPLVMCKIDHCPHQDTCSASSYGRVKYVNDSDDARLHSSVRYRSFEWKKIYKNRTCTERINKRVLLDYNLQNTHVRNGAKHAFFDIFAGIKA